MKAERVVLSFVALLFGLIAAGAAFYFYQSTKVIPIEKKESPKKIVEEKKTPSSLFLTIDTPKDDEVFDTKTITITGRTHEQATIIISGPIGDEIATPTQEGNFTSTITIDDGQNELVITAVSQSGDTQTVKKIVTYSTENF